MKRKLVSLVFTAIAVGILACATQSEAQNSNGPNDTLDKPILYMTPTDLFANPQLRRLAKAAQRGDVAEIDALIAKGVDVNGKGRFGITPLFSAWQVQNKAGYKALLEHGANPNNIWTTGHTMMNNIAESPDPYFMKLALAHGGNPNLVAPRLSETPLFHAVGPDSKVNLPLLINAGANLNHQDSDGETPLMTAAALNQYDAVYLLLKAGADYRIKDHFGKTVKWEIENSAKYMNTTGKPGNELKKVVVFLKERKFLPSDLKVRPMQTNNYAKNNHALVTNYEAPGNLKSTRNLECVEADQITNEYTPPDLYIALDKCLKKNEYAKALFVFAIAGTYTRFDTFRVADPTSHDANSVFMHEFSNTEPRDKRQKLEQELLKTVDDPDKLAALCEKIEEIGPPHYYPRYMVQHGMQAFTGFQSPKGLVKKFDAHKAWRASLTGYLHCPNKIEHPKPAGTR